MNGYKIPSLKELGAEKRIAALAERTPAALEAEIQAAIRYGTLEVTYGESFQGTNVVLTAAKLVQARKQAAVAAWKPSRTWLSTYQKGAIESFCRQSTVGFAEAFDRKNDRGAFEKLMRQKKNEIIDAILAFEFDWSGVAPKEVLDLVV